MRDSPTKPDLVAMARGLSAYMGEVVVRRTGGQWHSNADQHKIAVVTPDGRSGHPMHLAIERLNGVRPHGIKALMLRLGAMPTPVGHAADAQPVAEPARGPDDEAGAQMRQLAEDFVTTTAVHGMGLGWEAADASRLDALCDELLSTNPSDSVRESFSVMMGAYLGELLVRTGGGRWAFVPKVKAFGVTMPHGLRAFPMTKVAKRLDLGVEHDLFMFFWHGLTGDVPPDMKIHPRTVDGSS